MFFFQKQHVLLFLFVSGIFFLKSQNHITFYKEMKVTKANVTSVYPHSVFEAANGNYVVISEEQFLSRSTIATEVDSEGNSMSSHSIGSSVRETSKKAIQLANGHILSVGTVLFSSGNRNGVVFNLAPSFSGNSGTRSLGVNKRSYKDIALLKNGSILAVGNGENTSTPMTHNDYFATRMSTSGTMVWSKYYGDPFSSETLMGVFATADSGAVMVGATDPVVGPKAATFTQINASGSIISSIQITPANQYAAFSDGLENNGDYYIAGLIQGFDLFVAKFSNGNLIFAKQYESTGDYQHLTSVADIMVDSYGNIVIAGSTFPGEAPYILAIDTAGAVQFCKTYGAGSDLIEITSVKSTSDGGYILAGAGTSGSSSTVVLIKTDDQASSGCVDSSLIVTVSNPVFSQITNNFQDAAIGTLLGYTIADITETVFSDSLYCQFVPCPIISPNFVYSIDSTGQTYSFTNTNSVPGNNYLWHFGDGDSSTIENPVHTYLTPGTHTVSFTVTDENGCTGSVDTVIFILVGIATSPDKHISVFPNPTNDKVKISSNIPLSGKKEMVLRDLYGRILKSGPGLEISLAEMTPGMYLLEFYLNKTKVITQKILKQ